MRPFFEHFQALQAIKKPSQSKQKPLNSFLNLMFYKKVIERISIIAGVSTLAVLDGINTAHADTVTVLNSTNVTAQGSGATGVPSITNFNVPAGRNRVILAIPLFERDHCLVAANCVTTNSSGTGLGNNYASTALNLLNAASGTPQITARFIGTGGTVDKKNALVAGGTPDGDLRFMFQRWSPRPPDTTGTAFFSEESYHIAIFESEIQTLLGGATSGNISISLPDVGVPKSAGDDAIFMVFVFDGVRQTSTGIVRSGVDLTSVDINTGSAGNFSRSIAAFDSGQAPVASSGDGVLALGVSTVGLSNGTGSSGGYNLINTFTAIQSASTDNGSGIYDATNQPRANTIEPSGFSASAQFRNGLPSLPITMTSAAPNTLTTMGGMAAVFTLASATPAPELTLSKSDGNLNFTQGSNGVYTLTPKNNGTAATSGTITVTDTLPTELTYVSATGAGWTCSYNSGTRVVTCTSTTAINAGANGNPITLTVTASSGSGTTITNTAKISGGGEGTLDGTNNTASDTTQIVASVPLSIDYGDTPDTGTGTGTGNYKTTASDNGPSHTIVNGLKLGTNIDADSGTLQDSTATADDTNGTPDDEDAFTTLPNVPTTGTYALNNVPLTNTTSNGATLHAWVDFNKNGSFEATEYTSAAVANNATTANLSWTVPSGTTAGTSYARFRLTTGALIDNTGTTTEDERSLGTATDGEVEDYQVSIQSAGGPPLTCDGTFYTVTSTTPNVNINRIDRSTTPWTLNPFGTYTGIGDVRSLAYNPLDNYLYGITQFDKTLIQIDASGGTVITPITGVVGATTSIVAFTISSTGTGYFFDLNDRRIYSLNLTTAVATPIGITPTGTDLGDIAYNPVDGLVYGVNNAVSPRTLVTVNLATAAVNTIGSMAGITSNIGSMFFDGNGTLYVYQNSGNIYQVNLATAAATQVSTAPSISGSDGASCVNFVTPTGPKISGTLYLDNSLDAIYQNGEPTLPAGISVELFNDLNNNYKSDAGEVVATTTTDAAGKYTFSGIAAGSYRIRVNTADPDIPTNYAWYSKDVYVKPVTLGTTDVTGLDYAFVTSASLPATTNTCAARGGTSGPNLFSNGTFGTVTGFPGSSAAAGIAQVPSGFTYVPWNGTIFSPNDGQYTISNKIVTEYGTSSGNDLSNRYPFFHGIGDRLSAATGAAAIFNATNLPSVFYQETLTVTPNTTYDFSAWITNLYSRGHLVSSGKTGVIQPNLVFEIQRVGIDAGFVQVSATGSIPETYRPTWSEYGTTINSGAATQIIFQIRNTAPGGEGNDLALDDLNLSTCTLPKSNVLMVKRVTAINGDSVKNPNDNTPLNLFVDDTSTATTALNENHCNWPGATGTTNACTNTYTLGALAPGKVKPGDEVEYTIYYLNAGSNKAKQVRICDQLNSNLTFKDDAPTTAPLNIQLFPGTGPVELLTNATGDDKGELTTPALAGTSCNLSSANPSNNVVVVDVATPANSTTLSGSTGAGIPTTSYGYIRIKTTVK